MNAARATNSSLRRPLAALAGLTALMAIGSGVAASPALAGPNCASGYHCVFYSSIDSARHSYFNGDSDFSNDTFNEYNVNGGGQGNPVNDNLWSASNSSSTNTESHFYRHAGYVDFLFCLNPGHYVDSTSGTDQPGTQSGDPLPTAQRDQASSLKLPGRTSTDCY